MNAIYPPSGKAREYAELAVNLYSGCVHGCVYCYAPGCLRQTREAFHETSAPREGILQALEKDARKLRMRGVTDSVLLCFTTDPYQGDDLLNYTTRLALKILNKYDIAFDVLTKGGTRAARDFDLYGKRCSFATTLTFDDAEQSQRFEPFAALPHDRINALRLAHDDGIRTWVSFEPVLDADAVFRMIDATVDFVDFYKIGACSGQYSTVKNWRKFAIDVQERLIAKNKPYYLKNTLQKYLA